MEIDLTDSDLESSSESGIDFSESENALEKYSSDKSLTPEKQAAIDSLIINNPANLEQQISEPIYEIDNQKLSEQKKY